MVMYICEHCNFTTQHKNKYIRHLNRKNPCIPNGNNVIVKKQLPQKPSFFPQKPSFFPQKPSFSIQYDNDCIYCGKTFKRKDNLKRHMESSCKVLKMEMSELESKNEELLDITNELKEKNLQLETKVKELTNHLINNPHSPTPSKSPKKLV